MSALGGLNAKLDASASGTDTSVVAAVSGKRIKVVAAAVSCGGTPSTVVFNTKPAGAGTAISPIFNNSIVLTHNKHGWFTTGLGEGLSVSTGAGSTSGVLVTYEVVS